MNKDWTAPLFRLAWANGKVEQLEVDMLSFLMQEAGIPLGQRLALLDAGLSQPPKESPGADQLGPSERVQTMRALVQLCFADHHPHPKELELLGDLAMRWGISAEQLDHLRREALGEN